MAAKSSVYRINKFIVPQAARDEFLDTVVRPTHEFLRRQPGFVSDTVLEQTSGPGEFNIVAIIEFSGAEVVAAISEAVAELHGRLGVSPALAARLGIRSDQGNYGMLPL